VGGSADISAPLKVKGTLEKRKEKMEGRQRRSDDRRRGETLIICSSQKAK